MYIDPSTGRGFLAKVLEDGSIDKEDLQDPAWLKTNPSFFDPKVKVEEELNAYSKDIAKFTKVMGRPPAGGIWTLDSAVKNNPQFESLAKKISNSIASTPNRIASILTDTIGGYGYGETAEDGKRIETKWNLSTGRKEPIITEEMKADVYSAVGEFLVSQINYEEKQVEGTYRAPATTEGKETPAIPTIQDIYYTAGQKIEGGKYTPVSTFTMNVDIVDKSTKNEQKLKKWDVNAETGEIRGTVEEDVTDKDGNKTRSTVVYSNRRYTDEEGEVKKPDIAKLASFYKKIYDKGRGRYLKPKEVEEYLISRAKANYQEIKAQGLNVVPEEFDAQAYYNQKKGKK